MGKTYRGRNLAGRIDPEPGSGYCLRVSMKPGDVHLFMEIIQAYSHLGFPAVANPKAGLIIMHTTPDCCPDLRRIVENLPLGLTIDEGKP